MSVEIPECSTRSESVHNSRRTVHGGAYFSMLAVFEIHGASWPFLRCSKQSCGEPFHVVHQAIGHLHSCTRSRWSLATCWYISTRITLPQNLHGIGRVCEYCFFADFRIPHQFLILLVPPHMIKYFRRPQLP